MQVTASMRLDYSRDSKNPLITSVTAPSGRLALAAQAFTYIANLAPLLVQTVISMCVKAIYPPTIHFWLPSSPIFH